MDDGDNLINKEPVDFMNPEDGMDQSAVKFSAATQRREFLGDGSKDTETRRLEQQTAEVFGGYFGPDWRSSLRDTLLADVRVATAEDTKRVGSQRGYTETVAEATTAENRLVKNHIVVHQLPVGELADYALRTEIGEALYNLMENATVNGKIPRNNKGVPQGFESLVASSPESEVAAFCGDLLDGWSQAYNQRPNDRYSGLTGVVREYGNIPEWKSEGYSDGVAIDIKRKSGLPLTSNEIKIWNSFTPQAKNILDISTTQFLPPVVRR